MTLRDELQTALGEGYTVERELGGGGMSRVFLATDQTLDRPVVVKLLAPELAAGVNRERFQREILLAAQLQHPNIVPVLTAGTAGQLPYFSMPFVEGRSLRATLTTRGPLPVGEAVTILRDVARALAYAHGRGIVHRDIKPDNVLLSSGVAMVTDFGVAKALSQARTGGGGNGPLTTVGTSLGTMAYMAPEQAAADPAMDHRADLYSFGAMAYEMLSGSPPFAGLPPRELLTAVVAEEPPRLDSLREGLPPALVALVHRCLAKAPRQRPGTADEVLGLLEGTSSTPAGPVAAPRPRQPARARVLRWSAAVLGLLAVALAWLVGRREGAARDLAPANTLAVLPFARVGGSSADDYFSEGMTDELTTTLSRVPSLRVAAATSAFAVRRRGAQDVREVGRQLGVANVLEGTVRRADGRVRISARLTSTRDGLTRWADTYEREARDIFGVQDEIAHAIAGALRIALDRPPTSGPAPADLEAYDLYLRGRFYWRQRGDAQLRTAAGFFARAIARDSGLARAWAGLADALGLLPLYGPTPVDSVLPLAEHAAARAVELDSTLAEAHAALGQLYKSVGRWRESQDALDRAFAADSTYATAYQWQAELYAALGMAPAAVRAMEEARRLDPLSPIINGELAWVRALAGQWDSAFAAGRHAADLAPDLWTSYAFLGTAYLWNDQPRQAVTLLERAMSMAPGNPFGGALVNALARSGEPDSAVRMLQGLVRRAALGQASPASVSVGYVGLGDRDEAFHWLDRAAQERDGFLYSSSLFAPWFFPLRRDPRFAAVAREMGLAHAAPAPSS